MIIIRNSFYFQMGFNLVELTIVLVIISLLVSGALIPFAKQKEIEQENATKQELQTIKQALLNYFLANHRFPCPSGATKSASENGYEVLNQVSNGVKKGECARHYTTNVYDTFPHGFLPAKTLGIVGKTNEDGLLIDAWGNPYRYSVAYKVCSSITGIWAFTSFNGIKPVENKSCLQKYYNYLRVCFDTNNCSKNQQYLVVVVYSMGKNWQTTASTNTKEWVNAQGRVTGTSGESYYLKINSTGNDTFSFNQLEYNDSTNRDEQFDDIVVWISLNEVIAKLNELN